MFVSRAQLNIQPPSARPPVSSHQTDLTRLLPRSTALNICRDHHLQVHHGSLLLGYPPCAMEGNPKIKTEIKTYSRDQWHQRSKPTAGTASLRIAQREGFACSGNDAASVCGGNDAAAKTAGDATSVVVIQHHCSYMQSLLCTALDAIELKRMKWGNQRTENGGFVRGGDSWENLGLAEVGEWV